MTDWSPLVSTAAARFGRDGGGEPPRLPAGIRIYAIGDSHGRLDLATQLLARIEADAATTPPERAIQVFLGDFIDRGPDTCRLIDVLMAPPPAGFERVVLRGNHEEALRQFFTDPRAGRAWLANGGESALESYGIRLRQDRHPALRVLEAQESLLRHIPAAHRQFLEDRPLWFTCGDYLFVHAGVRPGLPLEAQTLEDLLWIREPFLHCDAAHGLMVVHGHTVRPAPDIRANRIGIDTGAWTTGRLTCLVLEGARRRFLHTGDPWPAGLLPPGWEG